MVTVEVEGGHRGGGGGMGGAEETGSKEKLPFEVKNHTLFHENFGTTCLSSVRVLSRKVTQEHASSRISPGSLADAVPLCGDRDFKRVSSVV